MNEKPNEKYIDQPTKLHDEFPDRIKEYEKQHPIETMIFKKKEKKKK